ncbi:male-specific lethal 3 homolog [Symsagittifera roscoffensis]|uniref:male-specific lethal 3 homolog n=1 Tax=Symsagittifera roscoffensis TaxID=84072 RepID=UPI00307BCE29
MVRTKSSSNQHETSNSAIATCKVMPAQYNENQLALCYEPDRSKLHAIYECIIEKMQYVENSRRRMVPQYYVRFLDIAEKYSQWVNEDYLLEDNVDNRNLMVKVNSKTIASSKLTRTSKLLYDLSPKVDRGYVRLKSEQKIPTIKPLGVTSTSSTKLMTADQSEFLEEVESSGEYSEVSTITGTSDVRSFSLRLPDRIMRFLEWDCYKVTVENKQYKLPQKITVVRILEDYLVWFVSNVAFKKKGDTYTLQTGEVIEVFDPLTSISLCKEILDGMRVYFDLALSSILLYKNETQLYFDAQVSLSANRLLTKSKGCIKTEFSVRENREEEALTTTRRRAKSLSPRKTTRNSSKGLQDETSDSGCPATDVDSIEDSPSKRLRLINQIKLLRSPSIDDEDAAPRTRRSTDQNASNTNDSESNKKLEHSLEVQKALDDARNWSLIPVKALNENDPIPPCLIFGAPYLFRFFVKFPQMITDSEVPDSRVKIILKHLNLFLEKYVVSRNDLFNVNIFK